MKMRLECPVCGNRTFEVEMDAEKLNNFVVVCGDCGECIATVNSYSIDWVEDDEDATDSD